jgi:NaMN:DMB phosphoribosyltransferase
MHPGEGCGAAAAMSLLDMAADVYREMSTFGQMGIQAYEDFSAGKA